MSRKVFFILLTLLWIAPLSAQERTARFDINFEEGKTHIDYSLKNNKQTFRELCALLDRIKSDSTATINGVTFHGVASPEGSHQHNTRLARGRRAVIERLVRSRIDIPESAIVRSDKTIDWELLSGMVESSQLARKQQVTDILNGKGRLVPCVGGISVDSRIIEVRKIGGGAIWRAIDRLYFDSLRTAGVEIRYTERKPADTVVGAATSCGDKTKQCDDIFAASPLSTVMPMPQSTLDVEGADWQGRYNIYLKTNLIGWGMAVANLSLELDIAPHWTFAIPAYYSAVDYFHWSTKFRVLTVQPELRWWPSRINQKFFLGAHFGFGYYNVAWGEEWRIQDHAGEVPALGGGLSVGYRMPLTRNGKLQIEFAVGAGAYKVHYDKFVNQPNGLLFSEHKMTFIGVDNASISLVWRIEAKTKAEKR